MVIGMLPAISGQQGPRTGPIPGNIRLRRLQRVENRSSNRCPRTNIDDVTKVQCVMKTGR
jgi:hypothetical protein